MTRASRKVQRKYDHMIGSRAQVMNGTVHHTSGGLTKADLFMNKNGRIVSKSKHFSAKRENRLVKAGFGTRKGKFGYVKLGTMRRGKKMRGGNGVGYPLSPTPYDGQGVGTSGPMVQIVAGQAGGRRRRRSKKMRGGNGVGYPLSPSPYDGQGVGTSGPMVQIVAGQAGGRRRRRGSRSRRSKRGGEIKKPTISGGAPVLM